MSTTFEQQFAVYEQRLKATHGKRAPSWVKQTKQLVINWQAEGTLTFIPLSRERIGTNSPQPGEQHHCSLTKGQLQQLLVIEEKRWQSAKADNKIFSFSVLAVKNAEKRYQISNLFCHNLLLATSDNIKENNTQTESTAEMMQKTAQLQLQEVAHQQKNKYRDASDQAAAAKRMLALTTVQPDTTPPVEESNASSFMYNQTTYPQQGSGFRGRTRGGYRGRGRGSYQGRNTQQQNVECWYCQEMGHLKRDCPHAYPPRNYNPQNGAGGMQRGGRGTHSSPPQHQALSEQTGYPQQLYRCLVKSGIHICTLAPGCCSHRVHNSATDFQSSQRYGTPIPSGPDIPPHSVPDHSLSWPPNCGIISLSHLEQQNPSLDSPEA